MQYAWHDIFNFLTRPSLKLSKMLQQYHALYWQLDYLSHDPDKSCPKMRIHIFLLRLSKRTMWKKVHFGRTMHCLPQRLKSTCFEFFFELKVPIARRPSTRKNFKILILVFKVIICMQPPKHTFEIGFYFLRFSSLWNVTDF